MAASPSEALVRGRATYQDVLDAPAHQIAEIVDGTLHTRPRPALAHGEACSSLGFELGLPFGRGRGGPGGWRIHFEPELHLGEDILVPDLAGWRRERMPELPGTAYFTLAPDWTCAVLSPSTRRPGLQAKRPIYAREGVGHLWLVDPMDRTSEAFELRDGEWVLIACAKDDGRGACDRSTRSRSASGISGRESRLHVSRHAASVRTAAEVAPWVTAAHGGGRGVTQPDDR